ncbi:hypothetical protein CAL14_01365 [Bordetella genomosp. 9]|nr:hypothetical protein CAL14_01365 [Bordetella genomosp. 9]
MEPGDEVVHDVTGKLGLLIRADYRREDRVENPGLLVFHRDRGTAIKDVIVLAPILIAVRLVDIEKIARLRRAEHFGTQAVRLDDRAA